MDNSDLGTTLASDIEAPALNAQAASAEAPRTSFMAGLGGGIKSGFTKVGHGITDGVDSIGKGVSKGLEHLAFLRRILLVVRRRCLGGLGGRRVGCVRALLIA